MKKHWWNKTQSELTLGDALIYTATIYGFMFGALAAYEYREEIAEWAEESVKYIKWKIAKR